MCRYCSRRCNGHAAASATLSAESRPAWRKTMRWNWLAMCSKLLRCWRGWHAIHVRFGPNTLKNFGEPSEPGVVLRPDEIFFIDIGPVWRAYEGDGDESFTVGADPQMLKAVVDVRSVFDATRDCWRTAGLTGIELNRFAQSEAYTREQLTFASGACAWPTWIVPPTTHLAAPRCR